MNAPPPLSELRKRFPEAFRVSETLNSAGFQALFAGGCVRDWILGRDAKDIDIASDANPDEVEALFPRTHAIGKSFGVIQVMEGEALFEVATFRRDLDQTDGRRPGRIEPSTPPEDAQRRDFTLNGLFLDPISGEVIDYVGGLEDLAAKRIRAIGDPRERFREDHLRMLRAARFAAVLGFEIEAHTRTAIRERAPDLQRISVERIRTEFVRMLTESPRPGDAVALLDDCKLLEQILPEFLDLRGCTQPPEFHPEGDVWVHTLMMLNELKNPSPALALGVLLHDIGKPATRSEENDRIRFTGHAQVGAEMAETWMRKMKFSKAMREQVTGMVDRHMNFMNVTKMRKAGLRRMVGRPHFEDELELHRIDCLCSNGITASHELLTQAKAEYEAEAALPEPWITGKDLMALGIEQGPGIGKWKQRAYDEQLEGRHPDKAALLGWVKEGIRDKG
ncbi:MAG: CCA tRNA nucleotidyltransferase [Verrucomicrobia bacterium]|nr:CCA tRNA nucleotidyltransferase [Verrucomicrobiota bacterium]MCH8510058.1 CCA tRNA nucleotidyltransferase [Kiritimatiellia bacterium]